MSKKYTEKEQREAIIDCAGSYHPAVGGKYLSWNLWLHIRKTYTDEIDKLERDIATHRDALWEIYRKTKCSETAEIAYTVLTSTKS